MSPLLHSATSSMLITASTTSGLTGFATNLVGSLGLPGIFVLMLLDSACIPIPSEVTMMFAGFGVSQGRYSMVAVVIAGVLGNLIGSQIAYAVGYGARADRVVRGARRLHLHESQIDRAQRWFDRYGSWSVLVGRVLPLVRTYISLPAGFARMPFVRFTVLTLVGCVPWVLAWAIIGDVVGRNWVHWEGSIRYVDYVVLALIALAVALVVGRWLRRRRAAGVT